MHRNSSSRGSVAYRLLLLFLLFCPLGAFTLSAQSGPVRFIDPAPPNVTVACFGEVPAPVRLRAERILNVSTDVRDTVLVSPTDNFDEADICPGGTLVRVWEIVGTVNAAREEQRISFGPAPANSGPVLDPADLPPARVTVDCRRANIDGDPASYRRWLTDRRVAVSAAAQPGCSPVTDVDDDAPNSLPLLVCNDELTVTFTVSDLCGNLTEVEFVYATFDDSPPVFSGAVADTIRLDCSDPVPPAAPVTITDCDPDATLSFTEVSTQSASGCGSFEYSIVRTWVAGDRCGNSDVLRRVYEISDGQAPNFERPRNVEIDCNQDPNDLDLTGRPINLTDNCSPTDSLEMTFTDRIITFSACSQRYDVERTWRLEDLCGNSRVRIQRVRVVDRFGPFFTPPVAELDVSCEDYLNLDVTGRPTNLFDQCDETVNISFEDDIQPGSCPGNFTVLRSWRVFDDCGNDNTFEQTLNVTDTTGPVLITAPTALMTTCNGAFQDLTNDFRRWVNDFAGATFADGCSRSGALDVRIVERGTDRRPTYPDFTCSFGDGTVRFLPVDIIATDSCGNVTVVQTEFRQRDANEIFLFDCPVSQVIPTEPGGCEATVNLPLPSFIETCSVGDPGQLNLRDTVTITSAATNPAELGSVPVDTVVFDLAFNLPAPVSGLNTGTITITLENIDAEGEEEFFFILDEYDNVLGTTARGNVQCEDVETVLTIPGTLFTRMARDGVVTIRLAPNVPAGEPGTFAVNNLCGESRALIHLRQGFIDVAPVVYEIDIDGTGFNQVTPIRAVDTILSTGLHTITYRARDCGGATDECVFTYTVEDREPPVVTCGEDIELILDADSCQFTFTPPFPAMITDNCEPYTVVTERFPADGSLALFPFRFDPNLNSFQAQTLTATLTDTPANLTDSVEISVRLRGSFSQPRAVLDVVMSDGTVLASSQRGDASCATEGTLNFRVAADYFATLRAPDGSVSIRLRPRPVTVPPGQTGDGVIPCNEDAIEAPTGDDGVSGAALTVTYRTLYPAYFTTGATVVNRRQTSPGDPDPTVTFNQGVTQFFYVIGDPSGNLDTCSFNVTVRDTTPPVARCVPTTVLVDPSGLEDVLLDPLLIGGTSTDNCGVDTLIVTPNVFGCDQYGQTATVRLTVRDGSGNQDTCSTLLSVAPLAPAPTASTNVCDGDTLSLRANPPTVAAPGQTIYTYQWFGPDNILVSTQENPVLPGVDEEDGGAYRVVIRGLTGCEAEGVVVIDIGGTPPTPVISAPAQVCTGENALLSSLSSYAGQLRYEWYRGQPGQGVLLGESNTATFGAAFTDNTGSADFYAIAYVNGCVSAPSNVVTVGRTEQPTVGVANPTAEACELGSLVLTATGPASLTYVWDGPDNFRDTGRTIVLDNIALTGAGTYEVRSVRGGGCFSDPARVELSVRPADVGTALEPVGTVCPSDTLVLVAEDRGGVSYVFSGPNELLFTTDGPELRVAPVTPVVAGDWTVTIDRGNCPSPPSLPVTVQLGTSPVAGASLIPAPICEGNDLILQGTSSIAGSTYSWTGPNGFAAVGIAPVLGGVDMSVNGDFVLTVTSPAGCSAQDTVVVDVLPGLRVDSLLVSAASCLNGGEPVSLTAGVSPPAGSGSDYSFSWTGPEGTSANDTLRIPNVSLASNGQYSLVVSDERGCVSPRFTTAIEFDFAPATPVAPFTPDGAVGFCAGVNLELMTNDYGPGTTYLWALPDGTMIPTTVNQLRLDDVGADASGGYTVRVLRGGCTSLPSEPRNLTVTEFPALNVTANDPACSGQAINFRAADLAGASYAWTGPNNFSSSLPNPTIVSADSTVHAGTYSVVAVLDGCRSDTSFVDVTVRPTPGVPVVQPIESVCISDPDAVLRLTVNPNTATPGASYQWFIRQNGVPVGGPTSDLTLEVTDFGLFAGGGEFDFTVSALSEGCGSAPSAPVTVRLDEIPDYTPNAGTDTVICAGLFILDAAPGGVGTGRWSLVQGTGDIDIINPTQRTTAVQGLTEFGGPYRFAWTLSNGSCGDYASDTVQLTVTDGEAAEAGDDLIACVREEVRLNATATVMNGSGGRWTQARAQDLLGIEIVSPSDPNTVITGLRPDNIYSFTWTVTSNCGVKEDVVVVNVSDPSPFAGEDQTVCNEERTAVLTADAATLGSSGRWRALDVTAAIAEPDSARTPVTGLLPGANRFVWEVDGGLCGPRSRDTVTIDFATPPEPADDNYAAEFQGTITFDPTENDNNPTGSDVAFLEVPNGGILTVNADGTYTLQAPPNFVGELAVDYLVTSEGCSVGAATVFVNVGGDIECQPPNIFTPNGDGMNDAFVVPCLLDTGRFPASQVTIYNQWGDEVYRSGTPYANDWDGTFQGSPLPVATYFYTVDYGDGREGASGSVRIER